VDDEDEPQTGKKRTTDVKEFEQSATHRKSLNLHDIRESLSSHHQKSTSSWSVKEIDQ
jgi:hypothetical protein